jgi:hypothetical protein
MKKIILVISIFSLLLSCSKDETPTIEPEKPVDFYAVGGGYAAGGNTRAILWKNGEPTYLTDGINQAYAYSVCVDQGNTYVVGDENGEARYWKNGIAQDLGTETANYFTKIQVTNNKVYILGVAGSQVKLWENGVPTIITGFTGMGSYPCDFKVVGDDKYVLIHYNNTVNLWKNGVNTLLSDALIPHTAKDLCVVGSDVYVLAEEYDVSIKKIKYWKNGVANYINNPSNNVYAAHIDVNNNNVFIGGKFDNKAYYWKNGEANLVGSLTGNSYNYGIQVVDNNVYTVNSDNGKIRFMKNNTQMFIDDISTLADPNECFIVYK